MVDIRLLGPVELWAAGQQVPLGPRQQRSALAVLAMTPRQPVPAEALVDRVWGDRPPRNVRNSLYTNLSRLRHTLAVVGRQLRRQDGGYLLDVDDDEVDLHHVRRLAAEGRRMAADPGGTTRAVEFLRAAHTRWRGTPLAGLRWDWAERVRYALLQELLAIASDRFELELRAGQHAAAIGPLSQLHAAHPLAEAPAGLLMRALYGCGHQAEALRVYTQTRAWLAEELGVEPGPALRELHERLVRGDPPPEQPAPAAIRPQPAQLPPDLGVFAGRERQLRELTEVLERAGAAPLVAAITGTGGVGKTVLAVHWAHRVKHRFPDGQLYVNLRGFAPDDIAVDPGDAVRGFLEALRVPPDQVPERLDAQVDKYRWTLAGRQVLVVLDNARDAEQVRPLLPGTAGCLAVVTSRDRLSGLAVAEGARLVTLDPLPEDEAWHLLAARLGPGRLAAEPEPVREIVRRCAGLPLALAIVAARAITHPRFSLAAVAGELPAANAVDGLDAFEDVDAGTGVRTVFSWSYRTLGPAAAQLFRLLGLHPGVEFAVPAAASLAGLPAPRAKRLLAELAAVHLLNEPAPNRYAFHDLLRTHAAELAGTVDDLASRSAARQRLLDHHLQTAHTAARLLVGSTRSPVPPPSPGVVPVDLTDRRQAQAWLTDERRTLLAAIGDAVRHGFDAHAWQLACAVEDYLDRQGYWHDLAAVERLVLPAVTRLGDRAAQAHIHRGLARACLRLGDYRQTHSHLMQALDRYRELGDRLNETHTTCNLVMVLESQGRYREALSYARQALAGSPLGGSPPGRGRALNAVGWCLARRGEYRRAIVYCRRALRLQLAADDRRGLPGTWHSLGFAHQQLGEYRPAISCYQHAVQLYRELDHRYAEATVLDSLGDAHAAARPPGGAVAARRAWERALAILTRMDHPEAELVRAKIERLDQRSLAVTGDDARMEAPPRHARQVSVRNRRTMARRRPARGWSAGWRRGPARRG